MRDEPGSSLFATAASLGHVAVPGGSSRGSEGLGDGDGVEDLIGSWHREGLAGVLGSLPPMSHASWLGSGDWRSTNSLLSLVRRL